MSEIRRTIEDDDIEWVMEWGANHPSKPGKEDKFEEEGALAILLLNGVIFLNSHHWLDDWPEDAKKRTSLNVNTNDIFMWGCADAETIDFADIEAVYRAWKKDPVWGTAVWACQRNNLMPQKPVYDRIKAAGIWDLDSMGLRENL